MTLRIVVTTCALWAVALGALAADAPRYYLVQDGEPRAMIVLGDKDRDAARQAAEELQSHIERISGATLPIQVSLSDVENFPADDAVVIVGAGALARQHGVQLADLPREGYRIKTDGRFLVFVGRNSRYSTGNPVTVNGSPGTLWAVDHFLDHQLGVRWLWPGDVGTYTPRRPTIGIPPLDITGQPPLQQRKMRAFVGRVPEADRVVSDSAQARLYDEMSRWKNRHQLGSRSSYKFGHAFTDWWGQYHEAHPEYFALSPGGHRVPRTKSKPDYVKLCISNPAVDQQIINQWRAAGAPDNWPVSPNDSSGFCVCDRCMAMDQATSGYSAEEVWWGKVDLTVRYVKFWNRLLSKMRQINPDVTISSYAYSAYRNPPPSGLKLHDGMVLGIVGSYSDRQQWKGWSEAGARLFLRPNWWHMGAAAPHLPLHSAGGFFELARSHGMIGYDFDSLMGYWATQGPYYYMIARLGTRPDLTVDDTIDEYVSAFGDAAPAIRDYLAYWERFANKAAYAIPAGGAVSQNPRGLYERALRANEQGIHPILGSWKVLPLIYTDSVVGRSERILDRAVRMAEGDARALQRIAFLRDGLDHLKLTRDVVHSGYAFMRPANATIEQFRGLAERLQRMRRQMTMRHVIWGGTVNMNEKRRGIPTDVGRADPGAGPAWEQQ